MATENAKNVYLGSQGQKTPVTILHSSCYCKLLLHNLPKYFPIFNISKYFFIVFLGHLLRHVTWMYLFRMRCNMMHKRAFSFNRNKSEHRLMHPLCMLFPQPRQTVPWHVLLQCLVQPLITTPLYADIFS